MKELTRAEEEIMQILWKLDKAFVKEIIAEMPDPKPAYNTVSTIVRILQQKEMVGYESIGKSHKYFPLITRENYSRFRMDGLMRSYFSGSLSKMVSFFVEKNKVRVLTAEERQALLNSLIEKEKEQ